MKHLALLSFILIIFGSGTLDASSTIYGSSGLITVPTARSLQYKEVSTSFDYHLLNDDTADEIYHYKVNLGTFQDMELGFVGGTSPDEGVYVNGKYYLVSDSDRFPLAFALGFENLASKDSTSAYLVASKQLSSGLHGHFGFKALFSDEVDPTVMGGLNYYFNNSIMLITDVMGEKETYFINGGVEFFMLSNMSIRAFALDLANATPTGTTYSVGLSFSKFL